MTTVTFNWYLIFGGLHAALAFVVVLAMMAAANEGYGHMILIAAPVALFFGFSAFLLLTGCLP